MSPPETRAYRDLFSTRGLIPFTVRVKETDLFILAESDLSRETRELVFQVRGQIEGFIENHPDFARSLVPCPVAQPAPAVVRQMAEAGAAAGVGPMAAVAGAVAEFVGRGLLKLSGRVIVENGGDVFAALGEPFTSAIHAGASPISEKLGILVDPGAGPMGICTSSGTIGHSKSFGCADAAVVVARSPALADAAATAAGNRVQETADLEPAVRFALSVPGVLGAVAVLGGRVAAAGELELVPVRGKMP